MDIRIEPRGRFGRMLAQAVERRGISLAELATTLDYSYEQVRKLWIGLSLPSPLLLKELNKRLDMDPERAADAVAADRIERKYGAAGLRVRKVSPRMARIDELVNLLTDEQFECALAMLRGLAHSKP